MIYGEVDRRLLGLSAQAYYAWFNGTCRNGTGNDAYLINAIVDAHGDDPVFCNRFLAEEFAASKSRGDDPGVQCAAPLSDVQWRSAPPRTRGRQLVRWAVGHTALAWFAERY